MAIKKCRECGKDVSTKAKTCPSCGCPKPVKGLSVWSMLAAIVVIGMIGLALGPAKDEREAAQDPIAAPAAAAPKDDSELPAGQVARNSYYRQVEKSVEQFALGKGMTIRELEERIGSPIDKIYSTVFALTQSGVSAEEAIQSLINLADSSKDPKKRRLMECMGVETRKNKPADSAPPSPSECAALEKELNPSPVVAQTSKINPSFNCQKAMTEAEWLICSSDDLSQQDLDIVAQYKRIVAGLPQGEAAAFKREQSEWRKKSRDTCTAVECIRTAQSSRLADLSAR